MDDELRDRRVEARIRKRQLLGDRTLDPYARLPFAHGLDEALGGIDGRDRSRPDPADELCGEEARAATDVEHRLAGRNARQIRELPGEMPRVAPHEPVVGIGGDLEAHRAQSTC